jgi:uncharacterized delta-60 repeat protein
MKKKVLVVIMMCVVVGFIACGGGSNDGGDTPPAAGSLDTSFGTGGIVVTDYLYDYSGDYYSAYNEIYAIAIQQDGKIVVAGYADVSGSTGEDFIVARYNTDGSLDTTFGTGGFVLTDFDNKYDQAYALAIQNDGKIVVAGLTDRGGNQKFAVARYTAAGELDNSFGTDGKVTVEISTTQFYDYAYALAIQSDGKIVVAGYSYDGSKNVFAIVRLNADGTLDNTFDGDSGIGNGIVTTAFTSHASASAIGIQADGKIIVAGNTHYNGKECFALVRYNANNGTLDTSFDNDGKVITEFGSNPASASSLALQADGKIVVAGTSSNSVAPGESNFALARYTTNGALDSTFGNNGIMETYMGGVDNAYCNAMKIQADGKIVVGGYAKKDSIQNFAILRYTASGFLDTTFGTDGKVFILHGNNNQVYSLAIQ